jgi:hypothetical protein
MDLLNAKDKQKIRSTGTSVSNEETKSQTSQSGVKLTPSHPRTKDTSAPKLKSEFKSTLPYAKRNPSYLDRRPSQSTPASKDDTSSSPSKWSDEVEEEEYESTVTAKVEYALQTAITSALIIEFMLILQRAISSSFPRKAIRGIIDTTRRTQPDTAFPLTLGKATIPLYKVVNHRHSMNHIVTLDNGPAPYLNPGKPVCTSAHCLLNLWPQIPTSLEECRQSSVSSAIQQKLEQALTKSLTLNEDLEHLKTLRDCLQSAHRSDFDHITNFCNVTLANYKVASVQDLVNLVPSNLFTTPATQSPSIDGFATTNKVPK